MYEDNFLKEPEQLKKYTTTKYLNALLEEKILLFSNPIDNKWDDKNDVSVLKEYQKRIKAKKIFAICFSSAHETIHLWKSYAFDRDGYYGCCINFNLNYLMDLFKKNKFNGHCVSYYEMKELITLPISMDIFPFIKRYPYRIEKEYRLIVSEFTDREKYSISIEPIKCIESIVLSPKITNFEVAKINEKWKTLGGNIEGFAHKTKVYKYKKWIKHFKNVSITTIY